LYRAVPLLLFPLRRRLGKVHEVHAQSGFLRAEVH